MLGLKSSVPVTVGTSSKDAAPKDTIPPKKTKDIEQHTTKKNMTKDTPKDATVGAERESQQGEEIKGLGGKGATSPCSTKCIGEPPKGQKKKRKDTKPVTETEVTLTEDDLEKIVDAVTVASEN